MAEVPKPFPACKVAIGDILEARSVHKEDGPDVVLTRYGEIGRVNIIAAIVNAQEGSALLLDDGSGRILVRNVEGTDTAVGDVVLCVSRPQLFQQQWYLVPEVMKKISPDWLSVRKKELDLRKPSLVSLEAVEAVPAQEPAREEEKEAIVGNPLETRVVRMVKQEDAGEGADEGKILAALNHPMTEQLVQKLVLRGDLFYVKPGRLKVLE